MNEPQATRKPRIFWRYRRSDPSPGHQTLIVLTYKDGTPIWHKGSCAQVYTEDRIPFMMKLSALEERYRPEGPF